MTAANGYAALTSKAPLVPFSFNRRAVGHGDVGITIHYCGVCHSDIHQARDEWGGSIFPMVPGHEIVGVVAEVGAGVNQFRVGDHVGVGCMVDSCLSCTSCHNHLEQYCEEGNIQTYNCRTRDGKEICQGGYSNYIVVREEFVLRIPSNLDMAAAAPLLCAGITTYSPLRHWNVGKGSRVGVVGLGGLGHMAVQLAHGMGAEVIVFTRSRGKEAGARQLGADRIIYSTEPESMKSIHNTLNLIIDTVGNSHDLSSYIECLRTDGTICLVGVPEHPHPASHPGQLITKRRSIAGSCIGGIKETQECLDFCGQHNIAAKIEIISPSEVNEAWERVIKGDVHYRFVIDLSRL